ncbi:hypothetical protein PR048_012131 [Dryococelus australis]|uniref:Uncharacterized protein n=1 Tax=Dryococelus australis TaxID=614101 RepID=A0ABQ9HP30_9NEOP|nr:hypothetical protein PR048_012131 [Dryococelus australis]
MRSEKQVQSTASADTQQPAVRHEARVKSEAKDGKIDHCLVVRTRIQVSNSPNEGAVLSVNDVLSPSEAGQLADKMTCASGLRGHFCIPYCAASKNLQIQGLYRTAVAEQLACSPPTNANRVQYLAGSLRDFHMWESCWTMPLVGGFSWVSPISLTFHYGAAPYSRQSPSLDLKTSLLRAAQISSLTPWIVPHDW